MGATESVHLGTRLFYYLISESREIVLRKKDQWCVVVLPFQTNQTAKKEAPIVHRRGSCSDTCVYIVHFRRFIQSEHKLAVASFFHPSS